MEQLQQIGDELAIRALVARYADAVHDRSAEQWGATWSTDGVWEIAGQTITGRDAIVQFWQEAMARFPFAMLMMGSGEIWLDGDTASGRWYLTEYTRDSNGEGWMTLAAYIDQYRRSPEGAWLFTRRRYDIRYIGPTPLPASGTP